MVISAVAELQLLGLGPVPLKFLSQTHFVLVLLEAVRLGLSVFLVEAVVETLHLWDFTMIFATWALHRLQPKLDCTFHRSFFAFLERCGDYNYPLK